MNNERDAGGLNQPQHNSVEITLRGFEQLLIRCRAMIAVAQGQTEEAVLVHREAALSAQEIDRLLELERIAREQLRWFRDAFQLHEHAEDLRHELYSAFSVMWADLEDLRPAKLVRYGTVDAAAAAQLEPAMAGLIASSRQIIEVLENG